MQTEDKYKTENQLPDFSIWRYSTPINFDLFRVSQFFFGTVTKHRR